MKIIKYISITFLFGAIILSNACKEDNLEVANPNELSPETYFTTEAQVQAAINAAYGSLQTRGLYNRHMWFGNDNMARENVAGGGLEPDKWQYLNYNYDPTHGAIGAYWGTCYLGIKKANLIITNMDKIAEIPAEKMSDVIKAKFEGEAKFLRGLYHFLLVTRFGDVPINIGDPTITELKRSPVADVYAQIEADLTDAAAKCLPRTDPAHENGRATKGAAYALLGKVQLFQGKYAEALANFQQVESLGYQLDPVFFDNFKEETEHGIESIFEVEFNKNAGYSAQWNSDRSDAGLNEATFRGQEYGFDWNNAIVSWDIVNEFEAGDPRLAYSIYVPQDVPEAGNPSNIITDCIVYNSGNDTVKEFQPLVDNGVVFNAKWRKYNVYYKQPAVLDNCTGVNFNYLRFADVLLMMAECQAQTDVNAAVATMNRVRNRADVMMPNYPTAEYPCGDINEFMEALEHERKVELAGEQCRLNDLVRWGRMTEFINEYLNGPYIPEGEKAGIIANYNENKILWPIPQGEIDANPGLTQADQNPGY
jgi:starch-binding outer membrane protein, SusD/RagB family